MYKNAYVSSITSHGNTQKYRIEYFKDLENYRQYCNLYCTEVGTSKLDSVFQHSKARKVEGKERYRNSNNLLVTSSCQKCF